MVEAKKTLVDQDYMKIKFEASITGTLQNQEVILFSAEIIKEKILFFKKKRVILVTNTHICIIDKNKKFFKKRDHIGKDLLAIT